MPIAIGNRALIALALIALAAIAGYLLGGDAQAALLMLVLGTAAVLLVRLGGEVVHRSASASPAAATPGHDDVIEMVGEPLLLIAGNRVVSANSAAQALLGQHIVGEDVRTAIRHPAAAERLLDPAEATGAPVHLVGLGTRDQRWEMRVRDRNGFRIVHLSDRTGSYATERMRVDFVANASHELRTPLASLLGYVETLQDEAGEDPVTRQRFLKIMDTESRRMQRLIDDLISLSRIEAEKYRKPEDAVDLATLIAEVRTEMSANNANIALDLTESPAVRGDRVQLSQLLHNIVGNAVKYGRDGGTVTISLAPAGNSMVRLSVADEGEGIPPEHLPRLTERFYRVDSGRSRSVGGTGLGLAIVKHIVERHRGRFDIASVVGTGTTISILLPAYKGSSGRVS
jgi:two-component system phosphate regulon sensor histidine kinase PhoR